MPQVLPIDRQIKDLRESKYTPGFEAVRGFFSRAVPALLTFSLAGVAVVGAGLMGLGLLGAMGVSGAAGLVASAGAAFGGTVPAALTIGGAVGAIGAVGTGIAGAVGAKRQAQERNLAMDLQIERLEFQALSEGLDIPKPELTPPSSKGATTKPSQSGNIVQNILAQGRQGFSQTFSPGNIAQRAAQDIQGSFEARISENNNAPSSGIDRS